MADANPGELILILEEMSTAVAAYTAIRGQFIDAGWSPLGAEAMVIQLVAAGGRQAE